MTLRTQTALNAQISEEAAQWFVEFRTATPDDAQRRRFDAWIRTSPEHLRAYIEIAAIWNEGPAVDRQHRFDGDLLCAQALSEGNVVPLEPGSSVSGRRISSANRRYAIAACIGLLAGGVTVWWQLARHPTYATGIGEQRSVQLSDGSTIELNARSKIKIVLNDKERSIRLMSGQALFRVARDPQRPFIVRSDETRVRAIGTQFDVYKKAAGTVVTVVEGRVAVAGSAMADAQAQILSAGEQIIVTADSAKKSARSNVVAATAWTQRQLVFEAASLQDIAEEFNRYSARTFIVENRADHDMHLSGVFSSTDLDFLVRFLRDRPGVEVRETAGEIRIIQRQ